MAPGDGEGGAPPTVDGPAVVAPAQDAVRHTAIVADPLSADRMIGLVSGPQIGGIACFLGIVRDHDHGRGVEALGYTAHPQAEERLAAIAHEIAARFEVEAIAAEHRVGHLEIGDLAVVVAVGARHRGPAIEACHALIDQIKQQVPIWKEQRFDGGDVEWVGL